MIIVKDCIRLPWLPPLRLERNARMVQNTMIENVQADSVEQHCVVHKLHKIVRLLSHEHRTTFPQILLRPKLTPMHRYHKDRHRQYHLHVRNLHRMQSGHRKRRRLLVLVVHLVKVLVQERNVIHAMHPVHGIILIYEHNGHLQHEPQPAVLQRLVVDALIAATVERVRADQAGNHAHHQNRCGAEEDLVPLDFGREEFVRLAFPFVRPVALTHVKVPLQQEPKQA